MSGTDDLRDIVVNVLVKKDGNRFGETPNITGYYEPRAEAVLHALAPYLKEFDNE